MFAHVEILFVHLNLGIIICTLDNDLPRSFASLCIMDFEVFVNLGWNLEHCDVFINVVVDFVF
jgi:hypothetical protein